jgi:hypothetical protein
MNRERVNIILLLILAFIIIINTIYNINHKLYKCTKKENYNNDKRPPGPWGDIGTGKPWYDYPYTLQNIEY